MTPSQRLESEIEKIKSSLLARPGRKVPGEESMPQAAVAMILRPNKALGEHEMLLIKRISSENDPWSGHMAFPGGHYRDNDKLILTTAIREVLEETGIDLRNCSMLGTLDEVIPTNRAIRVTPYVVLGSEATAVEVDAEEVSEYFWIPLSFFRESSNSQLFAVMRSGVNVQVPSFVLKKNYVIWGMTYRMITDFLAKVYGAETRVT